MTRRALIAAATSALVLVPLCVSWQQSLRPDAYSVMDMGTLDLGGGPNIEHAHHGVPVTELIGDPARKADVRVELMAARDGDRYTLNGSTPGPEVRVQAGQMLEVGLTNKNVKEGTTLHWHGLDLPNGEDGVAGVTQDAVLPGKTHTYRFVAEDPGTYWYHSHQVSHEQVQKGLFGALVVEPAAGDREPDTVALAHTYSGTRTLNGNAADIEADPGDRIRIINTDNGTLDVWSSAPYQVAAIDGRDLLGPQEVSGERLRIPAGGRADLYVSGSGARIQVGSATAVIVGNADIPKPKQPAKTLDLMPYGMSGPKPPFDPSTPDRTFRYDIGRRPGFLDGKPGIWWTVNGHMGMDVPMFMVREGDVVRFDLANNTGDPHPMHLHGHHALVTEFNDEESTGSLIWVDSLDLMPGDTATIVFKADNPGIWMDHCHSLPHAEEGLIAHLMYSGVTTPFRIGGKTGNIPE